MQRSQTVLGERFRWLQAKLGIPAAITAGANKLARIIHHLVKQRVPCDASIFGAEEEEHRK